MELLPAPEESPGLLFVVRESRLARNLYLPYRFNILSHTWGPDSEEVTFRT